MDINFSLAHIALTSFSMVIFIYLCVRPRLSQFTAPGSLFAMGNSLENGWGEFSERRIAQGKFLVDVFAMVVASVIAALILRFFNV